MSKHSLIVKTNYLLEMHKQANAGKVIDVVADVAEAGAKKLGFMDKVRGMFGKAFGDDLKASVGEHGYGGTARNLWNTQTPVSKGITLGGTGFLGGYGVKGMADNGKMQDQTEGYQRNVQNLLAAATRQKDSMQARYDGANNAWEGRGIIDRLLNNRPDGV